MPALTRYRVRLIRRCTQSAEVLVSAHSPEEAKILAGSLATRTGKPIRPKWTDMDITVGPYATSVSPL
jgi:hypothetical protein